MIIKENDRCIVFIDGELYKGEVFSVIDENEFVLKIDPPYKKNSRKTKGEIYLKKEGLRYFTVKVSLFLSVIKKLL